jgi:hypothetical protein
MGRDMKKGKGEEGIKREIKREIKHGRVMKMMEDI